MPGRLGTPIATARGTVPTERIVMSDQTASFHGDEDKQRESGESDRKDGDKSNHSNGDKNGSGENGSEKRKRPGKRPLFILAVVAAILLIGGFIWWFATRNHAATDDAYTDGNAITIAPQVSGYVVDLAINDNVYVHKGDLLLVIDKRDYQAQVDAAQTQLGLAEAQLNAALVQLDIARVQYPAQYLQAKAQPRRPRRI
jgi:membrane fusion protein (multidrug efflux system)